MQREVRANALVTQAAASQRKDLRVETLITYSCIIAALVTRKKSAACAPGGGARTHMVFRPDFSAPRNT